MTTGKNLDPVGRYIGPNCDLTKPYFKITNAEENHRGYQYYDGLNVLKDKFIIEGSCVEGGLYFSDAENILDYLSYGIYLRDIALPVDDPDLKMVRDPSMDKWRANKIILGYRYDLSDVHTFRYLISKGTPVVDACLRMLKMISKTKDFDIFRLLIRDRVSIKKIQQAILSNADINIIKLFMSGEILTDQNDVLNQLMNKEFLVKCKHIIALNAIFWCRWDEVEKYIKDKECITHEKFVFKLLESGNMELIKLAIEEGLKFENYKHHAFNKAVSRLHVYDKKIDSMIISTKFWDLIVLTIEHGVNLEKKSYDILKIICEEGDNNRLKYLIDKGVNIGVKRNLPLRIACKKGNLEMVKLLVESGINFKAYHNKALFLAIENVRKNVAAYLTSKGASLYKN